MQKFLAYTRVSVAKKEAAGEPENEAHSSFASAAGQKSDRVSHDEQRFRIKQYAEKRGLQIVRWFKETQTAAKGGRPVFEEILRLLKAGKADGVIFHKLDRSTRNYKDWTAIRDIINGGKEVHIAGDPLDLSSRSGRLTANLLAVLAEDHIENLRDETLKGIYGRLRQGLWPFTAPVGYLNRGRGKCKVVCRARGPLVRQAFELYDSGHHSLLTLAEELSKRGLRSKGGKKIHFNRLGYIIRNPFYIGLLVLKSTGEVFPGVHEPLVSTALFERVQARLTGNHLGSGPRRHHYLFRRLFRCQLCGCSIVASRHKGHVYYRCYRGCLGRCFREEEVEALVEGYFADFRFSKRERDCLSRLVPGLARTLLKDRQQSSANLEARLAKIETRLAGLTDALLDGLITKDTFLERKKSLLIERQHLEENLRNRPSPQGTTEKVREILELANNPLLSYRNGNDEWKRELVEVLTSNRHATPDCLVVEPSHPFSLLRKGKEFSFGEHGRYELRSGQKLPKRKARERTETELKAIVEELGKWVTENHSTFKVPGSAE